MITFVSVLKYEQVKVNAALERELAAMPAPLRDIVGHVLLAGGKRLRPLMTLASARLFGAEGDGLYDVAVIPEMIHVATLLHDDVLDGASSRRGRVSAHVLYDVPRAILAGDALLAAASHKTSSFGRPELLACVSESVTVSPNRRATPCLRISTWTKLAISVSSGANSCFGRWTMVTETPISTRFSAISRPIKPPPAKTAVFGF